MYFVKTPFWLKKIFSSYSWEVRTGEKELYLTFDDGPHNIATPFVLQQLEQFDAKATFFCIGKNVILHPEIHAAILKKGHTIGNHTHNHLNGWKVNTKDYSTDVDEASKHISSRLFRPPYGRITNSQGKVLLCKDFKVIMWDVLSGDFDKNITVEKCATNVIRNARKGSIIVFHDSEKAYNNLNYALPKVLEHFSEKGYVFKSLMSK